MCTVTFLPVGKGCLLASNRDEKIRRPAAIPPAVYTGRTGRLLYPKDGQAGGTWIAQHEKGHAIVFLNGAFTPHMATPPYRKSRGLILLDLVDAPSPVSQATALSLDGIEPFTAVIWENQSLVEFRWDGERKHLREWPATEPRIWSSVTLYTPEVIRRRESWFRTWIDQQPEPGLDDLLHFHQFTGDGDARNDLFMNRDNILSTVSITGMQLQPSGSVMHYLDTLAQERFQAEMTRLPLPSQPA